MYIKKNETVFPRRVEKKGGYSLLLILTIVYLTWLYVLPLIHLLFSDRPFLIHFGRFLIPLFIILTATRKSEISFILRPRSVAYLGISILTALLSNLLSSGINLADISFRIYEIITCWAVYSLFMYIFLSEKRATSILMIMAILATLNSIFGIWGAVSGKSIFGVTYEDVGFGTMGFDPATGRAGGLRGENYVGIWNVPALVMGLIIVKRQGWLLRCVGALFILLSLSSIVVSLSRTSVICGGVALIGYFYYSFTEIRSFLNRILFTFLLSLVIIGCLQFSIILILRQTTFFTPHVRYEMERRWTMSEILENERKHIWLRYLTIDLDNPFFGKGSGYIANKVLTGESVPHNSLIDIFVEHGVVALLIYIFPIAKGIRSFFILGKKKHKGEDIGKTLSLVTLAMFVALLFLSNPFLKIFWAMLGALDGRIQAIKKLRF